jgi:hypothetical protein
LGLLGDAEYDYDTDLYPQQQVPHSVPPPPEEDKEEKEQVVEASMLPVEQYQSLDLSEEEALRRDIKEGELAELGNWEGLGMHLAASTFTSRGGASSRHASASSSHASA